MDTERQEGMAGGLMIGTLAFPISCSFKPKKDITAFELATILPYFHGRAMYEEDWTALGDLQRHFVRY